MAKQGANEGIVQLKANRAGLSFLWQLMLLLGASGLGIGGSKMLEGKPPEIAPSAQTVPVEVSPAFLKLDSKVEAHHSQQEKDCFAQRARDESQDRQIESWRAAVEMLNANLSAVNGKLETLQPQLNQATQDVRTLTADIKKLLERQRPNSP